MKRTLPFLLLAFLAFPVPSWPREFNLTILFTNDQHGQVLPLSGGKGGVSRRFTLIQRIRQEVGPGRVLLVDSGDLFVGSALSSLTRGEVDCAAYQLMGYDAICLGNHDFSYGKQALKDTRRKFNTPWVSTNTVDRGTHQNFMKAYVFKTCGLRVGIIGLSNPDTPNLTARGNTRGLVFNPASAVVKGMRTLLAKESSVFIALSHLGLEEDQKLAKLDPFLHVIIGGHDHRVLEEPLVTLRKDGIPDGPLIVEAGSRGQYLGRLDLTLAGSKKAGYSVIRYQYQLIPVTSDIEPDPRMEALIEKYSKMVDLEKMEETVGRASSDLTRSDEGGDAWGQLAADAVRRAAEAEVGLVNSGTFRADLKEGSLTRASLYELIPFDDVWVARSMTGTALKQVLLRSIEKRGSGAFLQISGVKVKEGKDGAFEITVGDEPLENRRNYRVAMNDFLANGGDGYDVFRRLKSPKESGASLRDLLVEALKEKGSLSSGNVEKRWDLRK